MPITLLLGFALQVATFPATPFRPSDPRIQRVVYDPGQVVPLAIGRGYAAVIDLGADQQVDSIVVGSSEGWEVTATKRGDSVVVKPLSGASTTDMIVITADRRYVFLLQPSEIAASFVLSFGGPERAPVPLALSLPLLSPAATFRFRGARALFPAAMRSDGQQTFVTWGKATALPAIFAVDSGHEAIVNARMVGNDYVIEGSAARYVFRLGKERATATRQKPAWLP